MLQWLLLQCGHSTGKELQDLSAPLQKASAGCTVQKHWRDSLPACAALTTSMQHVCVPCRLPARCFPAAVKRCPGDCRTSTSPSQHGCGATCLLSSTLQSLGRRSWWPTREHGGTLEQQQQQQQQQQSAACTLAHQAAQHSTAQHSTPGYGIVWHARIATACYGTRTGVASSAAWQRACPSLTSGTLSHSCCRCRCACAGAGAAAAVR
jgi:hypothetical protein